ncbi:hypothetical protein OU995_03770 [Roseateles sp. SL47]|uniref:hypothetical protein n=1 Tax=Roseateles sp. SL47 TaxID=2995138 RepID=UPI00226DBE73|nr:hypothetical protein [Roseateles sp. SL47]WAC73864.1 hypothetical protein OU995_03770 [Roseateles sp. SL47]
MTSTFYVSATVSTDGNFADCTYYQNQDGTGKIIGSTFSIPKDAGQCTFASTFDSPLLLIGATFSTLGSNPSLNSSNFKAADTSGGVAVTMPTTYVATKGVVLLFSDREVVDNLYPSSDPQIINDGGMITSAAPTAS